MTVRVGDIVWYILRKFDAEEITARRDNFQNHQAANSHGIHPHPHEGWSGAPGYVAHIGNPVYANEQCGAYVTKVWPSGTLNLRVILDGSDVHYLRNVSEGGEPGTWQYRD